MHSELVMFLDYLGGFLCVCVCVCGVGRGQICNIAFKRTFLYKKNLNKYTVFIVCMYISVTSNHSLNI